MADNVTPFPRVIRPAPEPLGLYVRAGRNDHKQLLNLFSAGKLNCFGVVVDAVHVDRHKELLEHMVEHRLDVILDPMMQAAATVGGYTDKLGKLWGVGHPHQVSDFMGQGGRDLIARLGDFAIERGFTGVIAPTHLLQDSDDLWLPRDIEAVGWLRSYLDQNGGKAIPLIYSLAIPYGVFRNPLERRKLLRELQGIPASAIWLKVGSFGSSSTPTAACTYIEASIDFHELGIPIVGDYIGGLVGLALLAFGSIGGIAHGITMQERFDTSHWKKQRKPDGGWSMSKRVYFRELDLMLKPDEAKLLMEASPRAKSMFGCRDNHCCPHGVRDMLENPVRHFLYQRIQDVTKLGQIPETLRTQTFLENHVRPTTDRVLAAAKINLSDDAMAKKTRDKRKWLDNLRVALSHQMEVNPPRSFAKVPLRRAVREEHGRYTEESQTIKQ